MKKNILAMFLVGLLAMAMFSACGKGEGPTTPTLPNTFKITDFKYNTNNYRNYYTPYLDVDCWIYAQYTNNTSSRVGVTGMIKFWLSSTAYDLVSVLSHIYELPAGPNVSGQWKSEKETFMLYPVPKRGTYTIEAELIANFSNGPITSTFSKQITIE